MVQLWKGVYLQELDLKILEDMAQRVSGVGNRTLRGSSCFDALLICVVYHGCVCQVRVSVHFISSQEALERGLETERRKRARADAVWMKQVS